MGVVVVVSAPVSCHAVPRRVPMELMGMVAWGSAVWGRHVWAVAFHPLYRNVLFSCGIDSTIRVWDCMEGKCTNTISKMYNGHTKDARKYSM